MPDLHAIANRLAATSGKARWGLALLLGALATLAQPPVGAVPVLLIAVPGLLWQLEGVCTRRAAFALGWWFGFGYFVVGLYWISFALLVDFASFWWAMPAAVCGLPAVLSVFTGFVTVSIWYGGFSGYRRVFAFALAWSAAEWLRGHVFTGFPWLLAGYGWVQWTPVLQTAAITGIYGLSLLTMLVAALPALLGDRAVARVGALGSLSAGLVLFAGLALFGALRLSHSDNETVEGVRLRLVQANIAQSLKWDSKERDQNFQAQLALSTSPASPQPTHVIWPETAVTFFLSYDAEHRRALANAVPNRGLILTGAPRITRDDKMVVHIWNSLVALNGQGEILANYDKAHLVPFGEYLPGRAWLPSWLQAVATEGADFSAGPGPRTLRLPGLPPVSPLICYEAIFPGAGVDSADRPHWLLNLTNDAWYGRTAGPHQHFAIAQTRAVEEGMPLVRVANTGISGVVDAYGRVTALLGLDQGGFIDADLPRALPSFTPYGRWGDGILFAMMLGLGLFLLCSRPDERITP